ncbi:hypothetical protein DICPUDRAFT_153786 [Dictyostelium purpureum]|uniref:Uncharacterized protein n=1 Tax=Dictyostelium purpureum TaxID=5786 RepID=F0ZPR4_DICPU|nr:uncharacterized protein DICPUDRAFT_153786 [Dictyostelium purpureum]EGC34071.1 hypothetical protein DICPUDRAFT_153786 [Dictyostelium purpureum]|eukprot:XP_003289401.1 hypothetical protein DICPUDRAFT_153786 [Dictyostelium purpureum]
MDIHSNRKIKKWVYSIRIQSQTCLEIRKYRKRNYISIDDTTPIYTLDCHFAKDVYTPKT